MWLFLSWGIIAVVNFFILLKIKTIIVLKHFNFFQKKSFLLPNCTLKGKNSISCNKIQDHKNDV
ncbi:hypothetical protein HYN43_014150 [Mucilaginibacter celer]|uniref:Uncharacterized protein n=1 Tax=Mucilaginibacter celer TaxID=2305508 RepID=A0A494VM46_9SPHI|nr:hypothetical protein HYN43_014150 [Mucilaginibacter celer]